MILFKNIHDLYVCHFLIQFYKSMYIPQHAWQDHEPLIAMPAQDAHMEQRAQEVSQALGKDGNTDDILKARI